MSLNTEIKTAWVQALRSGKYSQGRMKLRQVRDGKEQFCCLGVLCDIYNEKIGGSWEQTLTTFGMTLYRTGGNFAALPRTVLDWSGLADEKHDVLTSKNDTGESFEQIAAYIEAEL